MDGKEQFFNTIMRDVSCSSDEQVDFANLFVRKNYSRSDFFIREGDMSHSLGFVESGIMRTYISDSEGCEANLRFIQAREFLSGSFARGVPSLANIQCLTDSSVYVSRWKDVFAFVSKHDTFSNYFNQMLANGHHAITQRLSSYIRNGATERYELFLREYPDLINHIPHYHIANFIGITPIQLSRIRRKLNTGK